MDTPDDPKTTGRTLSQWVVSNRGDLRGPQGLPIFKPPYSRVVAIDMSTGEFIWDIPNGETPARIKDHPALKGLDIPNTGQQSYPINMPTKTLLISAPGGDPVMYALDKKTGKRLGTVKLPAPARYGMMGYMHRGRQYLVLQVMSPTHPGSLAALSLPDKAKVPSH
jgi:quinoprotein glucose dehydrogenase